MTFANPDRLEFKRFRTPWLGQAYSRAGGTVETPTGVSKQLYDNAIVQEVHAVDIKKIAAGAATAGVIGLGGLGVGAGLAHADPHVTPPGPGNSDHGNGNGNGQYQWPPMVTGPGVNAGTPGNPLPPGQGFLPPPGHGGPALDARISYPDIPDWVTMPVLPPLDIPQPELPDWAVNLNLPAVWNPELNAWGVWDASAHTFVRL